MIRQGEVYWLHFGAPAGSAAAGRRPAVVVQHDRFNRSAISTIVVAAITSNLRLAAMPGNVRLRSGEGGLLRPSVVMSPSSVPSIGGSSRSGSKLSATSGSATCWEVSHCCWERTGSRARTHCRDPRGAGRMLVQ